ncbi:MAG: hypothetical protein ABH878_03380 [bacterium]
MEFIVWPCVVLILVIVVIFAFKKPIERLIDRTQKVSKAGLETGQTIQSTSENPSMSKTNELLKVFDNTLLIQRETEIREFLNNAKLTNNCEREQVLIRYLAAFTVTMIFEKVYYVIFGSQLSVLMELNSAGEKGIKKEFLFTLFEKAQANYPELYTENTVDRWLGFLESFSLISQEDDNIMITIQGREFLTYIIRQGYRLDKGG